MTDRGPSTPTFTGRLWYPFDPRPEDFDIEDIAHHLSNVCRYGGATKCHYSVAEHSVLVSELVPSKYALAALLHDAGEAVVGDMIKQIKGELPEFADAEKRCASAIWERFGVEWNDLAHELIERVDQTIVIDECLELLRGGKEYLEHKGFDLADRLGANVVGMQPMAAKIVFLARFYELTEWPERLR